MEFTLCGKPYHQVELWSGVRKGVGIVWFEIGRGWSARIYALGTFFMLEMAINWNQVVIHQ